MEGITINRKGQRKQVLAIAKRIDRQANVAPAAYPPMVTRVVTDKGEAILRYPPQHAR